MRENETAGSEACATTSVFERNPVLTTVGVVGVLLILAFLILNLVLEQFFGLGNPVLYDSNPLYGYRPQPNQTVRRFRGSTVKINNIGLRADHDWNESKDGKVLFLGDSVTYGGSYIANEDLFSTIAVKDLQGYLGGNAAVNGWGIDNMHGLVVLSGFLPARIYVTVLGEIDFYRRLTRLKGYPFWCRKPRSGLHELISHFFLTQTRTRYRDWTEFADEKTIARIVEMGVRKLREIDELLSEQGYKHLMYMTPFKRQVLQGSGRDELVARFLRKYDLEVDYLLKSVNRMELAGREKELLFADHIHLSKDGHELWARIIGSDLEKTIEEFGD